MLKVTDEEKQMFYTSGYSNNYILTFPDITLVIDNDKIHSETPVIKESICDGEEFALGGCIASSMEFEVSEVLADKVVGLEFLAQIEVEDDNRKAVQTVPMGIFRVDQSQQIDDKDYKKIVAYDRMYDISVDVTEWYNDYFADGAQHTIKKTRESLLNYLGIPFLDQTLINDDVLVEKTIEVTSLAGTDVLRTLCVLNGGFGRMNRQGIFEVLVLAGLGLFPEDSMGEKANIYPSETLYPEDRFEYLSVSDGETVCPEYRSCKYEEYMTLPITCLNIQSTADDVGITVGDDLSNPYVITANFFLYGKSSADLRKIGQNILGKIQDIVYRPNTTKLDGLPYLEVGDVFALEKKNDSVESYIFSRTLSGIQALIDTYEAKGNYIRANEVTTNEEIIQLKGKTLILKKSVDGVSSELTDFEKKTTSKFEQTDETISAEVKRATKSEGELSGRIDITAGQVVLKADANGRIVAVELTADPKDGTEFKVEADNISLSAEEAMEFLAGGTLNLTGQKIKIESDNFSVDESGKVIAKSIDITGGTINIETGMDSENKIEMKYIGNDGFTFDKTTMDSNGISYEIHSVSSGEDYVSRIAMEENPGSFNTQFSIKNHMGAESSLFLTEEESGSYIWVSNGKEINVSVETNGIPSPSDGVGLEDGAIAVDVTSGKMYVFQNKNMRWYSTGQTATKILIADQPVWETEDWVRAEKFIGDLRGDVSGNLSGKAFMAECDQNGLNIAETYLKDNISLDKYSLNGDIISMNNIGSLNPWQGLQGGYPTIGSGLYLAFGQVTFESVPESGTRACRILFDGQEQSVTQVISAYQCVLQCMAIFESETTSAVMLQCLQNSGSTLNCSGELSILKIK